MNLTVLYNEFFKSEKIGGLLLIVCTLFSIIIANSQWMESYVGFWSINIGGHSLVHWINDGLMAIFFLLIGLELEREIYQGELSDFRNALLPIFAAIGGMVMPAALFMVFNYGSYYQSGVGVPMATDIAFAIGILSLLGKRVPASLKIFLTALAVIDDLGAILLIAIFYTKAFYFSNLLIALGIYVILIVLNLLKVKNLIPYILGGIVMWYFMLNSGVHATITGVLLAFAIPYSKNERTSPSFMVQHFLHVPVAYIILPIFALANTSIVLNTGWHNSLLTTGSLGVITGLFLGKPLGIFLFSYLGYKLKLTALPPELKWKNIFGVGFLGGIGFTMSIFITILAFDNSEVIQNTKIAVLFASLLSGIIGYLLLAKMFNKHVSEE